MGDRPRRRSRVLEHFERQQAQREQEEADAAAAEQEAANNPDEAPQAGGEDQPFREFELAFGPDFFDSKGNE